MRRKSTVRAILIDPEKRTFTEIEMKSSSYKETNKLLGCSTFTIGAYLNGNIEKGFDCIAVNDDLLEDEDESARRYWFQVDTDRNPPTSYPICGRGVVQGVDKEGETTDAKISIDELTKRITFTQRKFRGFQTKSSDTEAGVLHVTMSAPIIDGASE
jgi:hypothetical protein